MWIVLDPEPDITVKGGFTTAEEAVAWVADQLKVITDQKTLDILRQCVVAPYDPERLT